MIKELNSVKIKAGRKAWKEVMLESFCAICELICKVRSNIKVSM